MNQAKHINVTIYTLLCEPANAVFGYLNKQTIEALVTDKQTSDCFSNETR